MRSNMRVPQRRRTRAAALEHCQSKEETAIGRMDTANCTGAYPTTAMTLPRRGPVVLERFARLLVGLNRFIHGEA